MGDHTLAYAYDALDNLTALTLPDGRQLNSFYYGSGHLLQLNLDALEISHFERDDLHREIMRSQGALTSRFGFDNRGRKAWQFASPLDSRTLSPRHNPSVVAGELIDREDNAVYRRYHYTSTGELASVEDKARPTQRYDYDLTGRLKRYWPAPLREEWFGYDQAANRILPGNDSSPRHMTVGDNRQRDVEGYRYAYDAWGNTLQRITQDEEQHFEYDSDNRLIRAQVYRHHQQVSDTRYHYDPLGRRIRKVVTRHDPHTATSSTTHTHFLWQGLRLLSDTQHQPEQPTLTRLYCYEQGSYAPLARIDTTGDDLNSPQVYYFHTDALGTPKEVTNSAGQIVWQADYKAWGEIDLYRVHQIDQPLRFQGQYADDETGLYYTTFRYYDPHSGRFTTQDPIGLAGGLNLYQYAPNPISYIDPLGLQCLPKIRAESYRSSGLVGKKRNIATSNYEINGKTGFADAVSGKNTNDSPFVKIPDENNRIFSTFEVGHSRQFDSEVKIFEHIASQFPTTAKGKINLYSELEICPSCSSVISQFKSIFPNIEIEINWGS